MAKKKTKPTFKEKLASRRSHRRGEKADPAVALDQDGVTDRLRPTVRRALEKAARRDRGEVEFKPNNEMEAVGYLAVLTELELEFITVDGGVIKATLPSAA